MGDIAVQDRELSAVMVTDFGLFPTTDGPATTAKVTIELTRRNGSRGGPQVSVDVGLPVNDGMGLRDLRLALLEQALVLLRRVVNETPDSLHQKWTQTCDEANSDQSSTISVGGITVSARDGG
jgi:hypothetical protein